MATVTVPFPTSAAQVQAFAGALFGQELGSITLAQVTADIQANGGLNNTLNNYFNAYFGSSSTTDIGNLVAKNLGYASGSAAAAAVTAALNSATAGKGVALMNLLNTFENGSQSDSTYGAGIVTFDTNLNGALSYTGTANQVWGYTAPAPIVSKTQTLTTGVDNLSGATTYNAPYNAANTFTSGDILAGTGTSTLNATMAGTSTTVSTFASTTGISTVNVTSLANAYNGGNNTTNSNVTINAYNMSGVSTWGDLASRADLVIDNIQLPSMAQTTTTNGVVHTNVTADVKFLIQDTIPGQSSTTNNTVGVNFSAYFDPQALRVGSGTTTSSMIIAAGNAVANLSAQQFFTAPLGNVPYTGFNISIDGKNVQVPFTQQDVANLTGQNVTTWNGQTLATPVVPVTGSTPGTQLDFYNAVVDAINAFNTANNTNIVVTTNTNGYNFSSNDVPGVSRLTDSYTLTYAGHALAPVATGNGWLLAAGAPNINGSSAEIIPGITSNTANLIAASVELDNAGHGASLQSATYAGSTEGSMGAVVIGSEATSGGVQDFEVLVDRGSWIYSLASTNNTLQVVNISSGPTEPAKGNGGTYVEIGGELPATGSAYNLTSFTAPGLFVNTNGLTDVQVVNATGFDGSELLGETLDSGVVAKYLTNSLGVVNFSVSLGNIGNGITVPAANANVVNSVASPLSTYVNQPFNSLNLSIDPSVAAAGNFKDTISGGTANDYITVAPSSNLSISQQAASFALKNIVVNAGAGNNLVVVNGNIPVVASAGTGNDTFMIGNDTGTAGSWVTGDLSAPVITTYTYSTQTPAGATAAVPLPEYVTVTYDNITVKAQIVSAAGMTSTTYTTTDVDNAIAAAVDTDPALSAILNATLAGTGANVTLTSKVTGSQAAPTIAFSAGAAGSGATVVTNTDPTSKDGSPVSASDSTHQGTWSAAGTASSTANNSSVTDTGSSASGYVISPLTMNIGGSQYKENIVTSTNTSTGANVIVLSSLATSSDAVTLTGAGSVDYIINQNAGAVSVGAGVTAYSTLDVPSSSLTVSVTGTGTDVISGAKTYSTTAPYDKFKIGSTIWTGVTSVAEAAVAGTTAWAVDPNTGSITFTGTPTDKGTTLANEILGLVEGAYTTTPTVALYDDGTNTWLFKNTSATAGLIVELAGVHNATPGLVAFNSATGVILSA